MTTKYAIRRYPEREAPYCMRCEVVYRGRRIAWRRWGQGHWRYLVDCANFENANTLKEAVAMNRLQA
jgi:hypothetical protein